ncbi:MAG: efflux RND transporter periplasmic adaptor subunit, partial [Fusobacteria bacterium]|nr:efflux RND transporter periplasmic adaptor subunit [Fusobacteriota bacterium]
MKKKRSVKQKITIAIVILIILGGVGFGVKKFHHRAPVVQNIITVETPELKTLVQKVSATGVVQPINTTDIYVSTALTVDKVLVQKGDLVSAGQVLMTFNGQNRKDLELKIRNEKIDLESKQIALQTTEYNEKLAKKTYQVNKKAFSYGGISKDDLEKSYYAVETAKIATLQAKNAIATVEATAGKDQNDLNLTVTSITSPVNGVVTDLAAQHNYTVSTTSNKPLATIANLTSLKINANISEFDIAKIAEGQRVVIQSEAFPNAYYGNVSRVSAMANSSMSGSVSDSSVPVEIKFKNIDNQLKPNYNVTLEIITAEAKNAMVLPTIAIYTDQNGSYVLTIDAQGNILRTAVTTGLSSADETQVIGLSKISKVITSVGPNLQPGGKLAPGSYQFQDNSQMTPDEVSDDGGGMNSSGGAS